MATKFRVEGLRALDAALGDLPRATARSVLRRVLKKAGQPIADKARALAPDDPSTGAPDLRSSISVSTKLKNNVGASEYAAVLPGGGTKGEAVAALRSARRAAKGEGTFAEVHVGPDAKQFHGQFQEFGTVNHGPQPFMRPAWDEHKGDALSIVKRALGGEIEKTAKRLAKRRAKAAAKG